MAWVTTRRVPWRRLSIEWGMVAAAMLLISVLFWDNPIADTLAAIVIGGVIYLLVGAVLAKLGYARKSLRELRAATALAQQQKAAAAPTPARGRPAPTKRTSTGPSQHPRKKKR